MTRAADILSKIEYLDKRYELKAYLKGSRLIKIKLPKNRVIIASYLHYYYGLDTNLNDIQKELRKNKIIIYEGEMPLFLED